MSQADVQHSTPPGPGGRATGNAVYGDDLLAQLRQGWTSLPNRTLMALAVGGLRVRMMRSTVTMLSIVFAIAFLAYTGLNNRLTYNLASAAMRMADASSLAGSELGAAVAKLRAEDPLVAMDAQRQRQVAKSLGMDQIEGPAAELVPLDEAWSKAQVGQQAAEKELAKVSSARKALAADVAAAQAKVAKLKQATQVLRTQRDALEARVSLGRWLGQDENSKTAPAADMPERLTKALGQTYRALIDKAQTPGRLTAQDVENLGVVLGLPGLDAAGVQTLSQALGQEHKSRQATELQSMLRSSGVNLKTTLEGDPLDTWLIVMALLTCAVGIANAMLMSVTERIREIGTMKCLGAQDNLVIKLFLLESMFLGLAGAILGIVIGIVVAVLVSLIEYRFYGLQYFPVVQGLPVVGLSAVAGMALAVAGATYPAWAASRMRPVDALRVDE